MYVILSVYTDEGMNMPAISMFLGIIITINYNDHEPPHFHARYQGDKATFTKDGK